MYCKYGILKQSFGLDTVGDFTNLYGSTVDDILDRIPDEATLRELHPVAGGSTEGFEFKWTLDGKHIE